MQIVLVDPSRTVLKYVTRLLEARGHVVHGYGGGAEALAHLKSDEGVEALITSAELVTMSGAELCWYARLLASAARPLYVILMSSLRDHHKVSEALDCGADDFISKPPNADELCARLRAAERVAAMQRELVRLATTDPLSGLFNRRAFFERGAAMVASAERARGLAALLVDIDHFKRVNDAHGHDAGDEVIRRVAQEIAALDGCAGRLGGEEFSVVLGGVAQDEAVAIADALRLAIARRELETTTGLIAPTCSIGVSAWRAGDTLDALLKRADLALYEAKNSGRNRVVAFDSAAHACGGEIPSSSIIRMAARR